MSLKPWNLLVRKPPRTNSILGTAASGVWKPPRLRRHQITAHPRHNTGRASYVRRRRTHSPCYFAVPLAPFKDSFVAPSEDVDPVPAPVPAPAEEEEALFALEAVAPPSSFENSRRGSPAPEISSRLHLKSNTLDRTTLNIWRSGGFRVGGRRGQQAA